MTISEETAWLPWGTPRCPHVASEPDPRHPPASWPIAQGSSREKG